MAADSIRLTAAQKRAILALSSTRFTDYKRVMRRRDTRMKLANNGITEPYRQGPVTMWSSIRLTERGAQLKERLTDA
jgi:hypothetical protein